MRFGFFLGFISASLSSLYLFCHLLEIPMDVLWNSTSLQDVSLGKKTLIFFVPLAFGFTVGMFFAALFTKLGKGNRKVESFLGSLWHYSSTGSMVWSILSIFQFVIGFGGAESVKNYPAMKAGLLTLGGGMASGMLICFAVRAADVFQQRGKQEMGFLLYRSLPLAVGIITGIIQCMILHIAWWSGAFFGLLYPFILIPWAQSMCVRDRLV